MTRNKKISEKKPQTQGKIIHEKKPTNDELVHFSFKHLDLSNSNFSIDNKNYKYFKKILTRLRDISQIKIIELLANRSSGLRCHPINWEKTSQPNGFTRLNTQLQDETPYQFEVSSNEHGRVHGFFIKNNFYIVWLDPDHRLYLERK